MIPEIDQDSHAIMLDASETAKHYLYRAVDEIDKKFQKGYAEKHPELVAAFIRAAATDFATAMSLKAAEDLVTSIDRLNERIADALLQDR